MTGDETNKVCEHEFRQTQYTAIRICTRCKKNEFSIRLEENSPEPVASKAGEEKPPCQLSRMEAGEESELKPCPFCGEPGIATSMTVNGSPSIYCPNHAIGYKPMEWNNAWAHKQIAKQENLLDEMNTAGVERDKQIAALKARNAELEPQVMGHLAYVNTSAQKIADLEKRVAEKDMAIQSWIADRDNWIERYKTLQRLNQEAKVCLEKTLDCEASASVARNRLEIKVAVLEREVEAEKAKNAELNEFLCAEHGYSACPNCIKEMRDLEKRNKEQEDLFNKDYGILEKINKELEQKLKSAEELKEAYREVAITACFIGFPESDIPDEVEKAVQRILAGKKK